MPETTAHVQSDKKWLPVGLWYAEQHRRLEQEGATKDKQMQQLRRLILRYTS